MAKFGAFLWVSERIFEKYFGDRFAAFGHFKKLFSGFYKWPTRLVESKFTEELKVIWITFIELSNVGNVFKNCIPAMFFI